MMTNEQLLEIAKQHVPDYLRPLGRIATRAPAVRTASVKGNKGAEDEDQAVARALATQLGVSLPEAESGAKQDSADVEFVESTPLGQRSTVVQIRGGQVANILRKG